MNPREFEAVLAELAAWRERLRQRMIALGDLPPDTLPPAAGVRVPRHPKPAPRTDQIAESMAEEIMRDSEFRAEMITLARAALR